MFAAYLTVLVLQLNPAVPLRPGDGRRAACCRSCCCTAARSRRRVLRVLARAALLRRDGRCRPGGSASSCSCGCASIASGLAATLMWLNLSGLRVTLDDEAARRMALGAVVLTLGVALLLALGVFRFSFGRGGRAGPAAFGLVVLASLAVPLWLRGAAHETPSRSRGASRTASSFAAVAARTRDDAAARRRVARLHLAGRRRWAAAEFRPHPRRRRGDAPGDAAADAARAGADGDCHRQAADAHGRAVRGARTDVRPAGPTLETAAGLLLRARARGRRAARRDDRRRRRRSARGRSGRS